MFQSLLLEAVNVLCNGDLGQPQERRNEGTTHFIPVYFRTAFSVKRLATT